MTFVVLDKDPNRIDQTTTNAELNVRHTIKNKKGILNREYQNPI